MNGLYKLTIEDLKDKCIKLGLSDDVDKNDLIRRIILYSTVNDISDNICDEQDDFYKTPQLLQKQIKSILREWREKEAQKISIPSFLKSPHLNSYLIITDKIIDNIAKNAKSIITTDKFKEVTNGWSWYNKYGKRVYTLVKSACSNYTKSYNGTPVRPNVKVDNVIRYDKMTSQKIFTTNRTQELIIYPTTEALSAEFRHTLNNWANEHAKIYQKKSESENLDEILEYIIPLEIKEKICLNFTKITNMKDLYNFTCQEATISWRGFIEYSQDILKLIQTFNLDYQYIPKTCTAPTRLVNYITMQLFAWRIKKVKENGPYKFNDYTCLHNVIMPLPIVNAIARNSNTITDLKSLKNITERWSFVDIYGEEIVALLKEGCHQVEMGYDTLETDNKKNKTNIPKIKRKLSGNDDENTIRHTKRKRFSRSQ